MGKRQDHGYRVAQIVTREGEGCIALLCGDRIVSRHFDWREAGAAYRAAVRCERATWGAAVLAAGVL